MTKPRKTRRPPRPPPGRHAVGNAAQGRAPDETDAPIDWWDELRVQSEDPARAQRKRGVAVNTRSKSLRKGRALESKRGQQ